MSFCFDRLEGRHTHAMRYAIDLSRGLSFKDIRKVSKPGVVTPAVDGMFRTLDSNSVFGSRREAWISRDGLQGTGNLSETFLFVEVHFREQKTS